MDIKKYFSRLFKVDEYGIEPGSCCVNPYLIPQGIPPRDEIHINHKQLKEAINFAWLCHAQETIVRIPGGCMTYKHHLAGQTMGRAGFELAVVQILDEIFPGMQVEIEVPGNE